MSSTSLLAFVITPAALGWSAVLLNEWRMKRLKRQELKGSGKPEVRQSRVRRFRGRLPEDYRFDRNEANER